ncbi:hypothetical protein P7C70_g3682, partial [Phenoliferia sp. Uapishka_3]
MDPYIETAPSRPSSHRAHQHASSASAAADPYTENSSRHISPPELLRKSSGRTSNAGDISGDSEELGFPPQSAPAAHDHPLQNDLTAAIGEFVGTFFFLYMAFVATQSALSRKTADLNGTVGIDNSTVLYVAFSFGFSLVVSVWVFFRISGAALNPAVSLTLWLVGGLPGRRLFFCVPAQLLGGIAAAGLAKVSTLGPLNVANGTSDGVSNGMAVAIELFCTMLLCFTVLMTAAEKSKQTFIAPLVIGLAVFVGHLASIGYTGAGINPARTLGPAVILLTFPSNTWVYYVGQIMGSFAAAIVYVIFKHLDYSEVVAGIDTSDQTKSQDISKAPLLMVIGYPSWNQLEDPASKRYSRTIVTRDGTVVRTLGKESA